MSFGFGFSLPAYVGYAASFGPSSFGAGTSLALDFLNGNNTLDPRITFSRTSNATLTNSAGVLTYAPHNLLTFSEQFDNAGWSKVEATIAANSTAAPDGSVTADTFVESTATTAHFTTQSATVISGTVYTLSTYAKNNGRAVQLAFGTGNFGSNAFANFDLSSGVVGSVGSAATATIQSIGNGWYRCAIAAPATTSGSAALVIYGATTPSASRAPSYTGDGTSGIYLWGAQLNVGALQPYYPTTVKNLLGYTQEFDNAGWSKSNATVTANAIAAPDGSLTADKLVETVANNFHIVQQSVTLGTISCIGSLYVKAAERTWVLVAMTDNATGSVGVFVNLATGAAQPSYTQGSWGASTATVVAAGNGWYRIGISATAGAGTTKALQVFPAINSTTATYTGDGTSGIYIWGAQLSDSASLDPYVYNPVAAPASTAYYGPRFDYDPVTLAPKGLLIEEQRTNLSSNSVLASAWGAPSAASYTDTQALAPDGTNSAWRLTEDTTNAAHFGSMTSITTTYTSGTTYTVSRFLKAAGRTQVTVYLPGGAFQPSGRTAVFDLSSGTIVSTEAGVTASIQNVGNGWYRCATTATANASVIAHVGGSALNGGVAYQGNGTSGVFIWGHQLEAGAFPTSYIPTTTAAATRAADVATMIGANFSNWYNQSEGTLFAEADTAKTSGPTPTITAQIAGGNDRHQLGMFTQTGATVNAGVVQSLIGVNTAQSAKLAYAYKANDFAAVSNGGSASTDTAGTVPASLTYATLGKFDFGGGESINGHLRRIAYYPRRLANPELQSITA